MKLFTKHLLLFASLWEVGSLYGAQEPRNVNFEIELGRTGKKIQVAVNLEEDTVERLYRPIEEGLKNLTGKEKKSLGIDELGIEKTIKNYMKVIKEKGLFLDGCSRQKVDGNMPLKEIDVGKDGKFMAFIPYNMNVFFLDHDKQVTCITVIIVSEPCMDVNMILDEVGSRLPQSVKKLYLMDKGNQKLGFLIKLKDMGISLKKIKCPTGLQKHRVFMKEVYDPSEDDPRPIKMVLDRYTFRIEVLGRNEIIHVEGLHNTASLQELGNYLQERGCNVEKIQTFKSFVDLDMDRDKRLYEAFFSNNYTYPAVEKDGFYFLIYFPSIKFSCSSLLLDFFSQKSSVKDLYSEVTDFLRHQKDDNVSFVGPILVGDREVFNTLITQDQTLEDIGIQNGDRIVAFETWEISFDLGKNRLEKMYVEDPKATFESLQKKNQRIVGDYVVYNRDSNMISSKAILVTLEYEEGDATLFLAEAKRVSYLKYNRSDGTSSPFFYRWSANENSTIASYTKGLLCSIGLQVGLLFTEQGKSLTVAHALNKLGSDKVDVMLYDAKKPSKPIQVTPYSFTVEWMKGEVSNLEKTTTLHPYETVKDLLNVMNVKSDNLKAVVINGNRRYKKENFSKTTLVQLGVEVHETINLRLENGDDISSNSDLQGSSSPVASETSTLSCYSMTSSSSGNNSESNHYYHLGGGPFTGHDHHVKSEQNDLQSNDQEKNGEKRWFTPYFYWIVASVTTIVVLVVGVCWLLIKDRIMTLLYGGGDSD